jgi:hypothetical protein
MLSHRPDTWLRTHDQRAMVLAPGESGLSNREPGSCALNLANARGYSVKGVIAAAERVCGRTISSEDLALGVATIRRAELTETATSLIQ